MKEVLSEIVHVGERQKKGAELIEKVHFGGGGVKRNEASDDESHEIDGVISRLRAICRFGLGFWRRRTPSEALVIIGGGARCGRLWLRCRKTHGGGHGMYSLR